MTTDRLAVVDVETTGLGRTDRVVEVAVVVLDASTGDTIDEFDSLVNPMRDVGPVHVHGVTASMVSAAPTFDEVAAALGERITGSVLVAHNLSFDARMLSQEYGRLSANLVVGRGICTLRLSGQRLNLACEDHGIVLGQHHRALADARATAELLRRLMNDPDLDEPADIRGLAAPLNPRTLRREAAGFGPDEGALERIVARLRYRSANGAVVDYLDMLDWVLDDFVITSAERSVLNELARTLGLSAQDTANAHEAYLNDLIAAAERDGVVTAEEEHLLATVAELLAVDEAVLPMVAVPAEASEVITAGMTVCFTGSAMVDGTAYERAELQHLAASVGLVAVSSVTKSTDLLVAADPSSMSGKTKKARQYGIPVLGIAEFLQWVQLHR